MYRSTIITTISSLLILLFTYTAFSKIANYALFQKQLIEFPWINHLAGFISWFIPAVELLAVVLLFVPSANLYGLYASMGLFVLFTGFLIAMLESNEHLPCPCGGIITKLSWKEHVFFNLFFVVLTLTGIIIKRCRHLPAKTKEFL